MDEYTMTCNGEVEFNDIYVIFSPNAFVKANSEGLTNDLLPRQLSYKDFQKWLVNNKKRDMKLNNKIFPIVISQNSN